ncbi:hypothetical protein [Rubricoccus marinus]|nr:hypothetical protein [Rubricoccus marinus]
MTDAELERLNAQTLFVVNGLPSCWLNHADELRDAAEVLWNDKSNGLRVEDEPVVEIEEVRDGNLISEVPKVRREVSKFYAVSRPYLLLAGFAIENLTKGILVAEDPKLISDGVLGSEIKTNNLIHLLDKIDSVEASESERNFCSVASSALPYWGRYPIPLHHGGVMPEVGMDATMREAYLSLHDRLGLTLYSRVKNGWDSGIGARTVSLYSRRYEDMMP